MKKALVFMYIFLMTTIASAQVNLSAKTASLSDGEDKRLSEALSKYSLITLDVYTLKNYLRKSKQSAKVELSLTNDITLELQ